MTRPRIPRIALTLLLSLAACSGSERPGASPPDAGDDQDDSSVAPPPGEPEPVWRPDSMRLQLSSFGFWEGSLGYDVEREQLSAEQIELLEGLREIETPEGPLGADFTSYVVRVTDRGGEVREYRAADDNVLDSDEGRTDGKRTIDYDTLAPFLAAFDCMSAKETGRYVDDAGTDKWNGAATFTTDPGCIHGVFIGWETSHSYRKWQIDEPGTYRLSIIDCRQEMQLHLYDTTGERELATSALETAPTCPTLVYTFDAPGEYRIDVEKRKSPTTEHDSAGDVDMRVSRE